MEGKFIEKQYLFSENVQFLSRIAAHRTIAEFSLTTYSNSGIILPIAASIRIQYYINKSEVEKTYQNICDRFAKKGKSNDYRNNSKS